MSTLMRATTRIAAIVAAFLGIIAVAGTATANTTLQQVIKQQAHPSLGLCNHRYSVYQLQVARIGSRWDALSSVTCSGATATTPNEISVYRLGSGGGVSLIQHLAVSHYNSTTHKLTDPQQFTLSARTITVGYSIWSASDPGCCPSHTGTRTFTWNGHGFTASKMHIH